MSEENNKPLGIIVRTSIDYNLFEGWMVTAVEGGSNYWFDIPESSFGALTIETYKADNLSFAELLSKSIWIEKETIEVFDAMSGEMLGEINMKSVKKALEKICENHLDVFERLMSEQYDAEDADVFFQYAVLGELTFG